MKGAIGGIVDRLKVSITLSLTPAIILLSEKSSNSKADQKSEAKNEKKTKQTGSYTNTHKSGKKYHGKGDKERMKKSGEEKAKKYNDPVKSQDWTPAENDREAFKQESRRMETDEGGYKSSNNYNKRDSPGTEYRKQDGE